MEDATKGADAPADKSAQPADADKSKDSEAWRNVQEIKEALKGQRELDKLVRTQILPVLEKLSAPQRTQRTEETKAETVSDVEKRLQRELDLRDAFDELGVRDAKQKELLKLAVAQKQPEDVKAFVSQFIVAAKETAPVSKDPAPKVDSGAPAAKSGVQLPPTPAALSNEVLETMSTEEVVKWYENYKRKSGHFENPLAALKRSRLEQRLNRK